MPIYEYEHLGPACGRGTVFEERRRLDDPPLERCPQCGGPVRKRISRAFVRAPKTNAELRDLGFTKLVRRDDGVYENVTAREGESRIMRRGDAGSLPDLKRTISD
ncbi:MAG: zinc ribbon domain-containing protein [Desulfobacterales bacterium]